MNLKQQKIEERKQYKIEQAKIRDKFEIERTLISEPEKLQKIQTVIDNLKKFMSQNPKETIYMAEISQVAQLKKFLFVENPSIEIIAEVLHEYGGIVFVDEDLRPIDGSQLRILEVTEIVKVPAKHDEKEINLKKLQKEIDKLLHKSKTGNKSAHESKSEFAQDLISIFSNPK